MRPFRTPYHWFQPSSFTAAPNLLLGGLLLVAGRRLFWIFVGAAGFLLGTEVAAQVASGAADWVVLVIGLAFGLAGLVLSLFVQKLAVAAAGFVMGSYAVHRLILTRPVGWAGWEWAVLMAGGILGALLVLLVFDWALIILSSLAGAVLITQVFFPGHNLTSFSLFAFLTAAGIAFQGGLLKRGMALRSSRDEGRKS
jgi:hypothetical protein